MENMNPPMLPVLEGSKTRHPGYPAPGTKIGKAWEAAWRELRALPAGEYALGGEIASKAADASGIAANTVANVLARMAAEGKLEREIRKVVGKRGPRPHVAYRVPQ